MGHLDSAKTDLREALQHDPNNRAVKKELLGIKKQLEQEKKTKQAALARAFSGKGSRRSCFLYDDKEEAEKQRLQAKAAQLAEEARAREKRKADWEDECVKRMARGEEAITFEDYEKDLKQKEEEEEKAKKKLKKEEDDRARAERKARREAERQARKRNEESDSGGSDDDEWTEKELAMLRGYKKTSDGRTTSYFTREQTEEEKKLLGNIAPKKLDAPALLPPQQQQQQQQRMERSGSSGSRAASQSSSVWNQAGTWEEKDTSEWCHSSLKRHLEEASVQLEHFTARVQEVKDLSGDASVAFVSGKKRYVFDYNASVKYVILDDEGGDGGEKIASGTLKLPDISSTAISDELEVDVAGWKKVPNEANFTHAHKCRDSLVEQIRIQVLAFVSAFNHQY